MLVNIIAWVLLGGVAGWLASKFMHRDAQMGIVANVIVGIIGASVGGFLFNLIGAAGTTGFNLWTLFVAFIGSVVLLYLFGVIKRAA
ncbi:MAG TPA: GlsB/YeaQ/YmgE family stress response membrane protein [Anaerolineae bacterium]|nr:GlsB/YeaQ/YmgE family stress response membrane protein [Anaerolineae bacterium]